MSDRIARSSNRKAAWNDFAKEIQMNIRRMIEIQAYAAVVPPQPAGHGQRTPTHTTRTRKGPRRGAVAARNRSGKEGLVGRLYAAALRMEESQDEWSDSAPKEQQNTAQTPQPGKTARLVTKRRKNARRRRSATPFPRAWSHISGLNNTADHHHDPDGRVICNSSAVHRLQGFASKGTPYAAKQGFGCYPLKRCPRPVGMKERGSENETGRSSGSESARDAPWLPPGCTSWPSADITPDSAQRLPSAKARRV